MTPSYALKVDRAKQHIRDVHNLLQKRRPFRYTIETDYEACESSIGAKRNEAVLADLALMIGDAVHNLRSALDHRVWELIAPSCEGDEKVLRNIQFPFASSSGNVEKTFKRREINRAAKEVWIALEDLKPYPGGNDDLCLVNQLDVLDKHKLLIPAADYTVITFARIRPLVPDFPPELLSAAFSGNSRDVAWRIPRMNRQQRRSNGFTRGREEELPIPVQVVLREAPEAPLRPLNETLRNMATAVERALESLAPL